MLRRHALLAVLALLLSSCGGRSASPEPSLVIGTPSPEVTAELDEPGPPEVEAPEVAPADGFRNPDRSGPPGAVAFRGAVDVPGHLLFFLVVGSDARPGQSVTRSRADSIHVAAVDPGRRRGTILGLPRDSYVPIPGHGRRKINAALALGGPDLLVRTVQDLTGFPIEAYAVTGFDGMVKMVDALGGLDVYVPRRMDDRFSGARFEKGWHHMDGREVLAFSRNRHLEGGDFTRSENQGRVIGHALEKLRAETSDEGGIRAWMDILFRFARLDLSFEDAVRLGKVARQLPPAELTNVVASGRPTNRGGRSVVELDEAAYRLFRDVGADAVVDGRSDPVTPRPTVRPTASPTPRPAPTPAPTAPPTPRPSGIIPVG